MSYKHYFMLFSCIAFSASGFAAEDNWVCKARDKANIEWSAQNAYQKAAINLAFEACKKKSKMPATCKTSIEDCEGFKQGISTKSFWYCVAFDAQATPWKSNYYQRKDEAALAAETYCKSKSAIPDTCFINFITCTNINQGASG